MNREKLLVAKCEAEEFIERAEKLLNEELEDRIPASKMSGRFTRQSMELTDALVVI